MKKASMAAYLLLVNRVVSCDSDRWRRRHGDGGGSSIVSCVDNCLRHVWRMAA